MQPTLEIPNEAEIRARIGRWINILKPQAYAWRITMLVSLVGLFSLSMSLVLFWRTLYLPELRQHAHSLATELALLREADDAQSLNNAFLSDMHEWLLQRINISVVTDKKQFPEIVAKPLADFFTQEIQSELEIALKEPVVVFFQFKPVPVLWIHYRSLGDTWIKEPLTYYAHYSLEIIVVWVLGIPILTMLTILILIRQLNRPLERLQQAALSFTKYGKANSLDVTHGSIEIKEVNTAFNRMLATIEKTERERNLMLAGISHDLRTPLTRMRLTAEMIADEFTREGLIYDIADMDGILQQFISYMRDGSDEVVQPTDINEIIREVVIQFKSLRIEFSPTPIPKIPLRALSIKRVLLNLVSNAQRYGKEPIYISADIVDSRLQLVVADEGDGTHLSTDDLFKPFVRGESARTVQGSGLGLSIVQRIIHLHHGEVTVTARNDALPAPQHGFGVTILLPLRQPERNKIST